jgi:hypothetical protein
MSNPVSNVTALCQALVDVYRSIPDLVDLVKGDPDNIFYSVDKYPDEPNISRVIELLPSPSLMVVWQRSGPGDMGNRKHDLELIIRTNELSEWQEIVSQATSGTPFGEDLSVDLMEIHESCLPIDDGSLIAERRTDENGVDYYVVQMSFQEK